MKFLFDFFPVIVFFAAYKLVDIYAATAAAIVASVVQVGFLKLTKRKVEPMMWIGLGIIVIAGGATLVFKNEMFIKWKPTILFVAMAIAIGVAQFGFKKNPIAFMFNNLITAPDAVWRKLAVSWIVFLCFVAGLNLWFAYYTSTEVWVYFKTFGDMALFFVFIIAQIVVLLPYMPDESKQAEPAQVEDKVVGPAATPEVAVSSEKV